MLKACASAAEVFFCLNLKLCFVFGDYIETKHWVAFAAVALPIGLSGVVCNVLLPNDLLKKCRAAVSLKNHLCIAKPDA